MTYYKWEVRCGKGWAENTFVIARTETEARAAWLSVPREEIEADPEFFKMGEYQMNDCAP